MNEGIAFQILVVEDDEDDRFLLDQSFQELHYEAEVKKFITGQALFRYLVNIDPSLYPSLIVLDNYLFPENAFDIISVLKKNPETSPIPVIVYSTDIAPAMQDQLLAAGADACIRKPASGKEMIEVCQQMIAIAELRRSG